MRILVLHYDHIHNPWLGGGGAHQLQRILSRLTERHQVKVICGGWPGGTGKHAMDGVSYTLAGPAYGRISSRLVYCIWAAMEAVRGDFDVLVEGFSAFSPTFASRLSSRPAIADMRLDPFSSAGKYPAFAPLFKARMRKELRRFNGIVAVSPSLVSGMKEKCPSLPPISVVVPGVDRELLRAAPCEQNYLLYLGRLDINHKGLDSLIFAYKRIKQKFSGIRLVIAGSGPDEPQLRRLIGEADLEDLVELRGRVEGPDKIDVLRRCLMVCIPSRREGWPEVATEAAACAKPVVGYDVSGLRDAVVNGETGVLVEHGNIEALAEAMRRVIENPTLRHRLGHAARERARGFTWKRAADSYEAVCQKVVSRR